MSADKYPSIFSRQMETIVYIFSCSTRYLTRSLRSLVRYRVEHSRIKFISTRGHVISSMYLLYLSAPVTVLYGELNEKYGPLTLEVACP